MGTHDYTANIVENRFQVCCGLPALFSPFLAATLLRVDASIGRRLLLRLSSAAHLLYWLVRARIRVVLGRAHGGPWATAGEHQ